MELRRLRPQRVHPLEETSMYTSRGARSTYSRHSCRPLRLSASSSCTPPRGCPPSPFSRQSFTLSFLKTTPHLACAWRACGGAVGAASFFPFAPRSATVNEAWTGSGSVYWRRCQVSSTICNRSSSPVYWFNIQYGSWVRCVTGRCRCTFEARACACIERTM